MPSPRGLILSKTLVPPVGGETIARPRVLGAMTEAAAGRRILTVVAPAGSGKTTAVAQLVRARAGACAWLSLWESDDGPGRFTSYLAAAVGTIDPDAAARTRRFLEDGLAPEDCAALLGESLPPGSTVVLDDLHHVEARAPVLRALLAFVDAAPDDALIVLVSRRSLRMQLGRDLLAGRVGTLPEDALAFRPDEIAALLDARGLGGRAGEVAASSGGWAAGIVFEALRGGPGAAGAGAEDPFFAYLGSEVLDGLPSALRERVLGSALLDVVDARRLGALAGEGPAEAAFAEICRHHLPGTLGEDGLRYHPRFREFLLTVLARERPGDLRELRARYGRALLADGHPEEAVDALLAAGERAEAEELVPSAAPLLMRRGDWDKALAWCAELDEETMARRPGLRGVQVRCLLMSRRQDDVEDLVRRMRASGEFDRLAAEAPDVAAWGAWALHIPGDWEGMLALTPPSTATRRARVIRFIAATGLGEDPPPEAFAAEELDRPWPLHVALQSALYYRGDFAEVERLSWAAAARGPVTATLAEIYRIAALRARGDLADARAALESAAPRVRASRFIEFWQQVEGELAFAEGDHERGLHLIRAARVTSREHGYRLADRAVFAAVEGRMLVRTGAVPEALEVLGAARAWCAARGLRCFREWADVGLATARLALGGDPAPVVALLEEAIAGMERAGRRLELPAAYVALAEARWRVGDEAAHDAAADAAHAAAVSMGTLGPLMMALEAMPEVLARRIDAAPDDDAVWRPLGRAGVTTGAGRTSLDGALLVVRTLGRAELESEGAAAPSLSVKAVELAAAVAGAGAAGVSRPALAAALFTESADAANHLRQLVHRLRRALPEGIALTSAGGRLAWSPAGSAVAEDRVLEALVARAAREVGRARVDTLDAALRMADRGPFLPGADGEAAAARRAQLAAVVSDARRDHARELLAAGRPARALAAARAAVADEPYREDGWQLLMRASVAAEGPASALPPFLACTRALAEVGLEPSPATRELLERLRGGRATGP